MPVPEYLNVCRAHIGVAHIVLFSFLAGLRAKEIAALTIANVTDEDANVREEFTLSPQQTKGRKARRVFVNARLQRELALYLKHTKFRAICPALFQSQKGSAGHLQEPFFVGIFSMTMADDAFYGGLVCIVSAKI